MDANEFTGDIHGKYGCGWGAGVDSGGAGWSCGSGLDNGAGWGNGDGCGWGNGNGSGCGFSFGDGMTVSCFSA